jgi:AcrR family transcriptional regulator
MDELRSRLSREESQEVTRRRLIEAAREQIVRFGVAAASIRSIAEAAGYSQGAIYSNFSSKEALLLEVTRDHLVGVIAKFENMATAICSSPANPGDFGAALDKAEAYFRGLNPRSNWSSLVVELQLNANRSTLFAAQFGEIRAVFHQRVGAALARIFAHLGRRLPIPAEEFSMGLLSTSVGFAIQDSTTSFEARGRYMSTVFRALVLMAEPIEPGVSPSSG